MTPPVSKKETQAFLGVLDFCTMHILGYSQLVSLFHQVTQKKNYFDWGPEQQQALEQINQEMACVVALRPVRTGPAV